jgi:hypothetical protein
VTITFFTTFNRDGLVLYGKHWMSTFLQNVTKHNPHISGRIYTENLEVPKTGNNIEFLDFDKSMPKHTVWKQEISVKQSINEHVKLETIRFSYKAFAIQHALRTIKTDYAIWLDGDCVFHNVDYNKFPQNLLDNKFLACQLEHNTNGGDNHVESGILIFDMNHRDTHNFLEAFTENYKVENLAQMALPFDGYVINKTLCQTNLPYTDLNKQFGASTLTDASAEKTFLHPQVKNKFTHNIGAHGKATYKDWDKVKNNNEIFKNLDRHLTQNKK